MSSDPVADIFKPMEVELDGSWLAEQYDPTPHPFKNDPNGWVDERLNEFLWSRQREVAESVVHNRYTAVPSCHDSGKSFLAARLACWWLDTRPQGEAFVVSTAPTWNQVHAILWREIRKAHNKGKLDGRTTLDARWYLGGVNQGDAEEELVAYGRKPADYDQAAFQGIHAKYVLIIIDEACGIPKLLYDAVDSLATNVSARVLAIGNPDDPGSQFATICKPGSGWKTIHISAFDTPNFTGEEVPEYLSELLISPEWVEERKKRWGVGSPTYVAKVMGEFPDVSDDTLISPNMIKAAQTRDLVGTAKGQLGGDVARMGTDETTVYRNRGGVCRLTYRAHKQDTTATTNAFSKIIRDLKKAVPMQVDAIGIGAGVYDNLNAEGLPVHPFVGSEAAYDPQRYINRRAEVYWELREDFEAGNIDLAPDGDDDDLVAQLGAIKFKITSKGKIQIESKEEMAKRGLPSPDRADALMMSGVKGMNWDIPSDLKDAARRRTQAESLTEDLLEKEM